MKDWIKKGSSTMTGLNKKIFVIFGGTGDLAYRKLVPAIYDLFVLENLNQQEHEIIVIGRRDYTNETYYETYESSILEHARLKNPDKLPEFRNLISYYQMDFNDPQDYPGFKEYLLARGNHVLFYLAVAPESFTLITDNLSQSGIVDALESKQLLIEKPFGEDLNSAIAIDEKIKKCFDEEEIYRIDHYLAKEMMLNILTIRFGNKAFETLWDNESIENIQISALEKGGVFDRGNYYDQTGALKDMFQSHLLQVLSYVLMPRPKSMEPKELHKAQQIALESLEFSDNEQFNENFVRGQYLGYLDEKYIEPNSKTETFVSMKLKSNDPGFKDVPIYVRTGKSTSAQSTYIAITFKPVVGIDGQEKEKNILIIRIGPDEGIYFKVNIKRPGNFRETQSISMDFCQSCIYENRLNTPQAYERLIRHGFKKDKTLFTSWPNVLASWQLTQAIKEKAIELNNPVYQYEVGQNGPQKCQELLQKHSHQWVDDEVAGQYFND